MNADAPARDALTSELDRWQEAGRHAVFWLRDDDATTATPALDRLIGLAEDHDTPLLLAVIPQRLDPSLPARLKRAHTVTPAVHGAWHENHAPPDRKAEETAPERGLDVIRTILTASRDRAVAMCGPIAGRWYVPPWNRIAPSVANLLPELGFAALSTFGPRHVANHPELAEVNASLDIIDWRGGRSGRPLPWLAMEAARLLAHERMSATPRPLGILAHHLQHDETAWEGLRWLCASVTNHPAAAWRAADSLLSP
jgi:hypothetical protein